MRRFIAMVVAITLVAIFPVNAYAIVTSEDTISQDGRLSRDDLVELAVSAFPEYSEKIRGEHTANLESLPMLNEVDQPEIILTDTRALSDNIFVSYQEYSNSVAFIGIRFSAYHSIIESVGYNGATLYLLDLYMMCTHSPDSIFIDDVACWLSPGSQAQIVDTGTPFQDILGTTPVVSLSHYNLTWFLGETTPAYVEYHSNLKIVYTGLTETYQPVYLRLDVGPLSLLTYGGFWYGN